MDAVSRSFKQFGSKAQSVVTLGADRKQNTKYAFSLSHISLSSGLVDSDPWSALTVQCKRGQKLVATEAAQRSGSGPISWGSERLRFVATVYASKSGKRKDKSYTVSVLDQHLREIASTEMDISAYVDASNPLERCLTLRRVAGSGSPFSLDVRISAQVMKATVGDDDDTDSMASFSTASSSGIHESEQDLDGFTTAAALDNQLADLALMNKGFKKTGTDVHEPPAVVRAPSSESERHDHGMDESACGDRHSNPQRSVSFGGASLMEETPPKKDDAARPSRVSTSEQQARRMRTLSLGAALTRSKKPQMPQAIIDPSTDAEDTYGLSAHASAKGAQEEDLHSSAESAQYSVSAQTAADLATGAVSDVKDDFDDLGTMRRELSSLRAGLMGIGRDSHVDEATGRAPLPTCAEDQTQDCANEEDSVLARARAMLQASSQPVPMAHLEFTETASRLSKRGGDRQKQGAAAAAGDVDMDMVEQLHALKAEREALRRRVQQAESEAAEARAELALSSHDSRWNKLRRELVVEEDLRVQLIDAKVAAAQAAYERDEARARLKIQIKPVAS